MKAFCEEFEDLQSVEVQFTHNNVPRSIPADVELCLFRVTQEGLRNIKRHSGANQAEIRLEVVEDRLHLSIADRGRGFDVNRRFPGDGIGILSMGQYDAVLISEFPTDEACAKFALAAGSLGNISTETLKAFPEAEYRKIISSLS